MSTWTTSQHLHQNIKLEATPSVKTCVSQILDVFNDARSIKLRTSGNCRSTKLQQTDCNRRFVKWFIFVQILMERSTSRSSTIPQRISSCREEEHEFVNQLLIEQYMCKIWWTSHQSSSFLAQRCDLEPIYERLLMGFILAYKGSRRLRKGWRWIVSKHTRFDTFDTVCAKTSNYIDRWHRCSTTFAHLAGLEHSSLVKKNTLLSWSNSKIGQEERSRNLRFYIVCWSLKSKSIQKLGNEIGGCLERTRICRKLEVGSPRSAIHLARTTRCFTIDIKSHIQNYLNRQNPESSGGRITFVSMFNEVQWTKKRQCRNVFA